jgi:AcrR family transcriptional regulator
MQVGLSSLLMTLTGAPFVPAEKPLRADARRNRERIVKAARTVFSDQGIDAQIDDVAKRAKVGVGTVYRHFPTKEALLDALVLERFQEIACGFIWRAAERNAVDRAFCEVVAGTDQSAVVVSTGLAASTELLMDRAKAQGKMRADATTMDVEIMMCGAGSVMFTILTAPDVWRRYLTLMLDGLRAS